MGLHTTAAEAVAPAAAPAAALAAAPAASMDPSIHIFIMNHILYNEIKHNQNAGEMIVLKLRTDNVKGFRPYHDLINTLIHELTHNVWGPHDQNFWKLFGEPRQPPIDPIDRAIARSSRSIRSIR